VPPSLSDSRDAGDSPIVQPGGTLPLLPDISYEEERDEIRGDPVDVGCHSFVAMAYTTSFVSARTPRGAIPYNSSFCPNDPANTMGRARIARTSFAVPSANYPKSGDIGILAYCTSEGPLWEDTAPGPFRPCWPEWCPPQQQCTEWAPRRRCREGRWAETVCTWCPCARRA
jgi:hypothetical protein